MNIPQSLGILVLLAVLSCENNGHSQKGAEAVSDTDEIIVSKEWLELTSIDDIVAGTERLSPEEVAQMKEALYRFYCHVKLENDYYECNLSSGEQINISEELFNVLLGNLKEVNDQVKAAREKGVTVSLPEVTKDYLNSLLR